MEQIIEFEEMKEHYKEIARLTVAGYRPPYIAEKIEMSAQTVRQILKKPEMRQAIEALSYMKDALATDLNTRLLEDANNSVDLLMDLRNNENTKSELRAKIAMDLLDRATICLLYTSPSPRDS